MRVGVKLYKVVKNATFAIDRFLRIIYNVISKGLLRHSTGNDGQCKHTGGSSPQIRKLKLNANNKKVESTQTLAFAA